MSRGRVRGVLLGRGAGERRYRAGPSGRMGQAASACAVGQLHVDRQEPIRPGRLGGDEPDGGCDRLPRGVRGQGCVHDSRPVSWPGDGRMHHAASPCYRRRAAGRHRGAYLSGRRRARQEEIASATEPTGRVYAPLRVVAQIRDIPAHVPAGCHEVGRDPAFGGPASDAPCADSERFRRIRGVDEVGHPDILSTGSARSAVPGELALVVSTGSPRRPPQVAGRYSRRPTRRHRRW